MAKGSVRRVVAWAGVLAAWLILVALGTWQVARGQAKAALIARLEAADAAPADEAGECPRADQELRRASVRGSFLPGAVLLFDNRLHAGQAGYEVISPLRLAGGSLALVNRGWVAAGPDRRRVPEVAVPAGPLRLSGRWRAPEHNPFVRTQPPEVVGGMLRSARVDPSSLGRAWGAPVCDLVLQLDPAAPHGFVREWRLMTFGPERHYGYAAQWYGLAAALAGLAIYAWRRT